MRPHLDRDLDGLRRATLALGVSVEQAFHGALRSLLEGLPETGREVLETLAPLERRTAELEESCLKTIALHRPAGDELRLIGALLEARGSIELAGELARDIARRSSRLSPTRLRRPPELADLGERARALLRDALRALTDDDASLARRAIEELEAARRLSSTLGLLIAERLSQRPSSANEIIELLLAVHDLELLAERAGGLAGAVIFRLEGELSIDTRATAERSPSGTRS